LNLFFSLSLVTSAPTKLGATKCREKITAFAARQQRIAQVAGGDEARGQVRDFALFLFDNGF